MMSAADSDGSVQMVFSTGVNDSAEHHFGAAANAECVMNRLSSGPAKKGNRFFLGITITTFFTRRITFCRNRGLNGSIVGAMVTVSA